MRVKQYDRSVCNKMVLPFQGVCALDIVILAPPVLLSCEYVSATPLHIGHDVFNIKDIMDSA